MAVKELRTLHAPALSLAAPGKLQQRQVLHPPIAYALGSLSRKGVLDGFGLPDHDM
jgi:hypothetical protein